jgi:exopolysaccharide biosynthesis polyprenyl glycosylphosphotransferase
MIGAIASVLLAFEAWAFWFGERPPHIRLWLLLMVLLAGLSPVGDQSFREQPRLAFELQVVIDLFTATLCTFGTWFGATWIAIDTPPAGLVFFVFLPACIGLPVCRYVVERITATMAPRRTYLIYGDSKMAVSAAHLFSRSAARIDIIGFIEDGTGRLVNEPLPHPVFKTIDEALAANHGASVDGVIIVSPETSPDVIASLRREFRRKVRNVFLVPATTVQPGQLVTEGEVASLKCYLLGAKEFDWPERAMKRFVDLVIASVAVVFFMPLMLICAVLIKLESPGPVIYRQLRFTTDAKLFECYKLRTMRVSESNSGRIELTQRKDARVTRVGKFLRRTSLDEIPQFINVLQGHMSVVGPRPHPPGVMAAGRTYEEIVTDFIERYKVKPGITGLAQVSGLRGNTFTEQDIEQRFQYDIAYISNWSLALETLIILKTLSSGFWGKNAF